MKASVPAISPSYGMWVLTKTKSLDSSIVLNSATVMSVNPFSEPAPWQPDRSRSVPVVITSIHLRMASLHIQGHGRGNGPDNEYRNGPRLRDSSAADAAFAQHPGGAE